MSRKKKSRRQSHIAHSSPAQQGMPGPEGSRPCRCGSAEFLYQYETFKDDSIHVRQTCAKCRRFIKWLPHSALDQVLVASRKVADRQKPRPQVPQIQHGHRALTSSRQRWFLTARLGYSGPIPKYMDETTALIDTELAGHREMDASVSKAFLEGRQAG